MRALFRKPAGRIFLITVLLLACFKWMTFASPNPAQAFYLGGIQVNEPDAQAWVQGLKQAKMNTVEVTVYAKQGDWDSDNLWFDAENEGVVNEIRAAKAQGLHVSLILRVALDHAFERNEFLWHGQIMPRTEEQLASWFEKYSDFVMSWAQISEAEGVDILGVSSEMNALTSTQPINALPDVVDYYLDDTKQQRLIQEFLSNQDRVSASDLYAPSGKQFATLDEFLNTRLAAWQNWARQVSFGGKLESVPQISQRRHLLEKHWRQLIRETRSVYSGKLTYAANFDQYHEVAFWDALDQIGVNAYFSLRSESPKLSSDKALAAALETGWQEVLADIEDFRQRDAIADKPVLFTELGYTHRNDSTVAPWAYEKITLLDSEEGQELLLWDERTTNLKERAIAINALYQVLQAEHPDLLEGILYWKLSTLPEHMAIEPFVLILNDSPQDPLQEALARFVN